MTEQKVHKEKTKRAFIWQRKFITKLKQCKKTVTSLGIQTFVIQYMNFTRLQGHSLLLSPKKPTYNPFFFFFFQPLLKV